MTEQNKNSNKFLLFFIIFLTSFSLGFYISQNIDIFDKIEEKQPNQTFVDTFIKDKMLKKDLNLDLFWQVYNIVSQNYYSADETKNKDLEYGVIDGFVKSLGDKFSEFMTPELTKEFESALSGDFEGIGAVINKHELGIVVDRVLKGSPALKDGVLQGDIIVEANGIDLKDLTSTEAVNYIKGPAGTKVTLKIIRSGESDFLIKEITRDKIKIPSVDTLDMKDEEIGYITLNLFGENTSKEFLEMLNTFQDEKVKGIIIDLRDNGGGYLNSAVEILSHFIENGKPLVTTKYKDSILNNTYYSENVGKIFDKKLVLLINGNSASASEITAGALKDYNKAILVGEKSYGKGSVQQPFDLPDGSMLKLTIAKWYTPKDVSIDHNGIEPDIKVSFKKEDYTPQPGKEDEFVPYDRQLEEAKVILKKFIKLGNIGLVVDEYEKEHPELSQTGTTSPTQE
ncbi:MAG: S41 family peptidase [Candidatus Altimarinota bacterium]